MVAQFQLMPMLNTRGIQSASALQAPRMATSRLKAPQGTPSQISLCPHPAVWSLLHAPPFQGSDSQSSQKRQLCMMLALSKPCFHQGNGLVTPNGELEVYNRHLIGIYLPWSLFLFHSYSLGVPVPIRFPLLVVYV